MGAERGRGGRRAQLRTHDHQRAQRKPVTPDECVVTQVDADALGADQLASVVLDDRMLEENDEMRTECSPPLLATIW